MIRRMAILALKCQGLLVWKSNDPFISFYWFCSKFWRDRIVDLRRIGEALLLNLICSALLVEGCTNIYVYEGYNFDTQWVKDMIRSLQSSENNTLPSLFHIQRLPFRIPPLPYNRPHKNWWTYRWVWRELRHIVVLIIYFRFDGSDDFYQSCMTQWKFSFHSTNLLDGTIYCTIHPAYQF